MATEIWVKIGLLPDGTKPLPEPMLTFTASAQATILYNHFENHAFKLSSTSPGGQWVNRKEMDLLAMTSPLEHINHIDWHVEEALGSDMFISVTKTFVNQPPLFL